jgi:hypothetical protein
VAIVDIRVLSGEKFNILETGATRIATATADALFPIANLYDGRPSRPFREAAITACQIIVDGNQLVNGNLDTWSGGAPTGWTELDTGSGYVNETTVAGGFVTGSAATMGNVGAGAGAIYQDITVKSGQKRRIQGQFRTAVGIGGGTQVEIKNLQTGRYLTSANTWQTAQVTCLTGTSAAVYALAGLNYTVEAYSVTQSDLVTLRVRVFNDNVLYICFADDVVDFPAVDVVSVHGHNLDVGVGMVCTLRSSTDNFVGVNTTEATLSVIQPAFYGLLPAAVYRRYWLLDLLGTPTAIIELGEVVIGQTYALTQAYTYGAEMGFLRDDVATETGLGEQHVYARGKQVRRTLGLKFKFDSEIEYRAARDEIFKRSGGRVNPIVVIPDTTLPDVIFGRIDRSWKVTRSLVAYYENNDLVVVESPGPIATN